MLRNFFLRKLLNNKRNEWSHFFTACKDLSFFCLDLRGTIHGQSILKDADKLYDLPVEEKHKGEGVDPGKGESDVRREAMKDWDRD